MGRDRQGQAGTGTGEKCSSAEEGENDIMKNRWESMVRGKRDEKREKDRREERSLFVWKEDLKHVVPLYTRIVRGSRFGKIKKKPRLLEEPRQWKSRMLRRFAGKE